MSAWAKPGVKCVCIRDDWKGFEVYERMGIHVPSRLPMINEVLTINEVMDDLSHVPGRVTSNIGLTFVELGHDWGFALDCFRPLITKSQEDDVALFRSLLDALPIGESA